MTLIEIKVDVHIKSHSKVDYHNDVQFSGCMSVVVACP